MTTDKLAELRKQIDEIDSSILKLLEKRMKVTDDVGRFKIKQGISTVDLNRENELFSRLMNACQHPILKQQIKDIYSQIVSASKKSQEELKTSQ